MRPLALAVSLLVVGGVSAEDAGSTMLPRVEAFANAFRDGDEAPKVRAAATGALKKLEGGP